MEFEDRDLLIEYLNGHLDEPRARALEARIAEDADLQAQLAFERRLRGALRASPAFVQDRLAAAAEPGRARRGSWPLLLVPTAAALLLAVTLLPVGTRAPSENADFRTLTDAPNAARCAELTVVAHSAEGLDRLLGAIDQQVLRHDPQTLSAVVSVADVGSRSSLVAALEADDRVRMVIDACAEEP